MQGLPHFVPTETKVEYLNRLLQVGFDTLDFGSFVSPKAIPQMRDTAEVLENLHWEASSTRLLAIVANQRGADDACAFEQIGFLGFPFSVSETFQQRNTGASMEAALSRVEYVQNQCVKHKKQLVVYLSMAFGNPYGDPWHPELVTTWSDRLFRELDVRIQAPSDTVGSSDRQSITPLFESLIESLPEVEFGAHLHSTPEAWKEKIEAAYEAGVRRFDGALKGYGGCPMAKDDLTGNVATERLIAHFDALGISTGTSADALQHALQWTPEVFDPVEGSPVNSDNEGKP